MFPIQAETKLTEIAIPFRSMIFEEAFSRLLWQSGHISMPPEHETVLDLANFIKWDVLKVCQRLTDIQLLSENTRISCQQLVDLRNRPSPLVILDVRDDEQFANAHITHSISIGCISLPEQFLDWQQQQATVVTIGHEDGRAFSACLYLKEMGLETVFYLAGGYLTWAEFCVQPS